MTDDLFSETFHKMLEPVLAEHGFRRIVPPHDWMAPTQLFESQNRWFGASWDRRDRYLEVSLGRLFCYRDVMRRAIIQGPYTHHVDCGMDEDVAQFMATQLAHVAASLPSAVETFNARIDESLRTIRASVGATAKNRRIVAEHLARIGDPLSVAEWTGCRIIE